MIRAEIEGGRVPSLAVAVARRGEIVWEEAFGWADPVLQIPATPHTMYSLASVSKPATATGLMVLVERGEVDLDRPINDYLGESGLRVRVGDPQGATVQQVADHTSGLPLHHHFFLDEDPGSRPSLEETIARYGNLITEPGKRFEYSNLGYAVLEYLIERVSGESFADFMQEEVFGPLGLEHTSVLRAPRRSSDVAVRVDADGPMPFYQSDHGGGSALFSCVHDLVRFGLFHLRARLPDQAPILSARAIGRMQRSSSRRPTGGYYGIGWAIYPGPIGARVVRHDGGMPGASASLVLLPAQRVAVAVLSNTRSMLPQRVSAAILAQLAPQVARRAPGWGEDATPTAGLRSRRPRRRLVGVWSGEVELGERQLPMILVVERASGPRARLGAGPESRLWRVAFGQGGLTGWMTGRLGEETAGRGAQLLRLDLKLRGDRLSGAVTAFSRSPDGLPSALSYWAALERSRD